MTLAGLVAILASAALLAILGARDPKRLRNRLSSAAPAGVSVALPPPIRRICAGLALLPGVVLAVAGQWWDLCIWFGAVPAAGWAVAQALADRQAP